jgi:excinuclease UvrABC helicase subunit UvrB
MGKGNQKKLSKFLTFFINRPNHLAKYLIDNDALNKDFLNKISSVDLPEMNDSKILEVYFVDINQMNNFFKNLVNKEKYPDLDNEGLLEELEKELQKSIMEERYEDAIRIRDYLKNIPNKRNLNS